MRSAKLSAAGKRLEAAAKALLALQKQADKLQGRLIKANAAYEKALEYLDRVDRDLERKGYHPNLSDTSRIAKIRSRLGGR